jgi:HPr kinase/phosphorylase
LPIGLLVGDDRVHLEAANGRIVIRPAPALAGLLEIRGVGLLRLPYEPAAVVGLVVDLAHPKAERLPPSSDQVTAIQGITLPLLAVAAGNDPLPLVLIKLRELAFAGTIGETPVPAQVGKK